jgi:hypothetical protein
MIYMMFVSIAKAYIFISEVLFGLILKMFFWLVYSLFGLMLVWHWI